MARPGPDRQFSAPDLAREAGLRHNALEEHHVAAMDLSPLSGRAGKGQETAAQMGAEGTGRRLRRGHALYPALQPVGPTPMSRAEQRFLRGHTQRHSLGRDGPDRDIHRERHPAAVRRGTRGGYHRHRDRARAPGSRGRAVDRRWCAGRFFEDV